MKKTFLVDEKGYYGEFGGAYVPEILYATVEKLKEQYLPILESKEFQEEYMSLLRDYVGRPSPLYLAKRMSERYGCKLYLKREDILKIASTVTVARMLERDDFQNRYTHNILPIPNLPVLSLVVKSQNFIVLKF